MLGRRHPLTRLLAELSSEPHCRRIQLSGLSEADVGQIILSTAGVRPPAPLLRAVCEKTEGNPFFVSEIIRLLADQGQLEKAASDLDSLSISIPESVREVIGRRLDTLHAIGTGGASDLWCQIHADVMNRPIRQVAGAKQGTLRGAGLAAFMALGILKREDIPNVVKIEKTFEPNPANRAVYDTLFAEFVNAYKANKRIFARLNRNRKHERPQDNQ